MSLGDYLPQSLLALAIPVLAYVAGLAYISEYLAYFGMSANEFELPLFTVLGYSIAAIPLVLITITLVGILILGFLLSLLADPREAYVISRKTRSLRRFISDQNLLVYVIAYFIVLSFIVFSANSRALADAEADLEDGGVTTLPFNSLLYIPPDSRSWYPPLNYLSNCLSKNALRLLFSDAKRQLYVCRAEDGSRFSIFLIGSDNKLLSMRTK